MSEQQEQRSTEQSGPFARLSELVQHGSVPADPELIRTLGTRRLRRHRAGQAALGTGALAAVVVLAVLPAMNASGRDSGHRSLGTAAAATTKVVVKPAPSNALCAAATGPMQWVFSSNTSNDATAAATVANLKKLCFSRVFITFKPSDTVAVNEVIDIVDTRTDQSLLGKEVSTDTEVTVVGSSGPAH